jgi:AAA family ATP:ADP antiporter
VTDSGASTSNGAVHRLLSRAIDVRPAELRALGWSWLYIISVFVSYYILRPIRDEMGVAGGVENLQWLFTGTLLGMIAVNPPFAALVAKLPRVKFIGMAYRFFAANLLLFVALLHMASAEQSVWIGRIFFIWASVFNLFVVSVFWALMVDVFDTEQSKRLFGFIAAGATVGGIIGSSLTAALAKQVPATYLLLASAILLEVAVFCVGRLSRLSSALRQRPAGQGDEAPIGGSVLSGMFHALKSPYLINVSVFLLLFAMTSTFLYFQQAEIARKYFADRGARTAFFAQVDLWVNILTLGAQLFVTGRTIKRIGVALTLALLPLLSIFGFGALAWAPTRQFRFRPADSRGAVHRRAAGR